MIGLVYKTETGNDLVENEWTGFHNARFKPDQPFGWREKADGTREYVLFDATSGKWQNDDDLREQQRRFAATGKL